MKALFKIETDRLLLNWGLARGKEPVPYEGSSNIPGLLIISKRRQDLVFENICRISLPDAMGSDHQCTTGPRIFEQTDYKLFVQAKANGIVSVMHRDPLITRDLSVEDDGRILHGFINFGSQVGRSLFTVIVDGRPEFDFQIEVFPTKIDYASDYEEMLSEVQEILTGLALEYLRSTFHWGTYLKVPQPTNLEWITLLQHVINELERALQYIALRPIRSLTREQVTVRAERVKRIDSSVRYALLRGLGKGSLMQLNNGVCVREQLLEQRPRPTLDTPEHRWLAGQLRRIHQRIVLLRRVEMNRDPSERRRKVLTELTSLESKISRYVHFEPFVQAQGDSPAGFASLQLLSAPGYREAYRCCLVLSMGLRIEGGAVRLSVKDINLLYEYWCYLALLRLVSEETGLPIPGKELFTIKQQGLQVMLQKGRTSAVEFDTSGGRKITIAYNPRFKGDSFLIPQQPDVLITLNDPKWPNLHLILDAKYRIDASPEYKRRYITEGPPEDALNVLHRYRDAILENDSVNPGEEILKRTIVQGVAAFPYRDKLPNAFRGSFLWRSLGRIGVGAIPLLPGSTEYLRDWLRSSLRQGGWALSDKAIDHSGLERAREWRTAAAESVLVDVLRGKDEARHLNWIIQNGLYYKPLLKNQRRQFASKWLAIYSPITLRNPGAVTHRASIKKIEVVRRDSIKTPWISKRNNEFVVLYRLQAVEELKQPIENKRETGPGHRFSTHRWTSLLALERAGILKELLLETEPEWRLYEDLCACGVSFYLDPGPAKLIDPANPAGRVWFITAEGLRIRYAGASGFILKDNSGIEKYFLRPQDVTEIIMSNVEGSSEGGSGNPCILS